MMKIKAIAIEIISTLFVILFIYAAASKLMDIQKFRVQIGQSPLLTRYVGLIIYGIPALEILISSMIIYPALRKTGLYASFTLMTAFTLYIVALLHYDSHVPCSCGGILQKMSWNTHIWFNTVFIILSVAGILLEEQKEQHFVAIK
ncbi:MAG: hypothetical protein Q8918_01040 [Bacteroidota bacterium]|nr:hypothetical protein [Bacteroidota bacterium]MDP4212621.1 hypothetical protein [Bacteroidota bacterium]MDP4248673.1 hypothetical protein [Bacteroidota bacterium]